MTPLGQDTTSNRDTSNELTSNILTSNSTTSNRSTSNGCTSKPISNHISNHKSAKRQSQVPFWCKRFVKRLRPQKRARDLVERVYWDVTVVFKTGRQSDMLPHKDSPNRRPHRNRYQDKHIFRADKIQPHTLTSNNGNKHKHIMHETIRIFKREWSLQRPPTSGEPVQPRKGPPDQWRQRDAPKLHVHPLVRHRQRRSEDARQRRRQDRVTRQAKQRREYRTFCKAYMQKEEMTMAGVSPPYPPAQETHRILRRDRKQKARAASTKTRNYFQAHPTTKQLTLLWARYSYC